MSDTFIVRLLYGFTPDRVHYAVTQIVQFPIYPKMCLRSISRLSLTQFNTQLRFVRLIT